MDFVLCAASLLFFHFGGPASALLLRCGLEACGRFSPRAALALSAAAACAGTFAALLCRGGLHSVPHRQRADAAFCGIVGGTLGRAALLMLAARLPGSAALSRIQIVPLLALTLIVLCPAKGGEKPAWPPALVVGFGLVSAAADGFFGAGGTALFALAALGGISRRQKVTAFALLLTLCAQGSAIVLTLLCDAEQIFPTRMLVLLSAGSALGAALSEMQKERGTLHEGMRAALMVYLILAALSCAEQAYSPGITAG